VKHAVLFTRAHATAIATAIATATAMVLTSACDKKPSTDNAGGGGGSGAEGGATAVASSTPGASRPGAVIQGHTGCALGTPGGSPIPKFGACTLSLAAANGKALLVDTAHDASSSAPSRADRVVLGPTGAPEGEAQAVGDAASSTFATALVASGELSTLAFTASTKPTTPGQCAEGLVVLEGVASGGVRRELTHACRTITMLRGAGSHELGLAFLDGPAEADAWVIDGSATHQVHLESLEGTSPSIDGGAVAAGATSLAAAWVVKNGVTRELHAARVDRKGELLGKVMVIDKRDVGSVSIAFEAETLYVVWSSFAADKNRYLLKWNKWPAGGTPTAPQSLGTGVLSAYAPAIAYEDGRFVLAWTEGADEKSAVVKVGSSKVSMASIPGLAVAASTPGAAASAPVVAVDHDAMFLAWHERGATSAVRASTIKCVE
jgi:hypothetical protein